MSHSLPHRAIVTQAEVELLREARRVIRQEADALIAMAEQLSSGFCEAVELIQNCRGSLIVTGVGKAGLIGQKLVATFASTGTKSYFLHPTEARHGDLGCVGRDDVVLALSNSGESEEILSLLPAFQQWQIPVIALTRDDQNRLARGATVVVCIGRHKEAGDLGLAPSCSTTAMLAMGDALALVLSRSRGFTSRDFAAFHPAGSLGRQLCPVREVMRRGSQLRIASETETVREVMIHHSRPGRRTGAVILTNSDGRLTGLFTDSDLARLFEQRRDEMLDQPISLVMTRNPITTSPHVLLPEVIHLMSERKLSEVPVIDGDRMPVGMLDITDVLQHVEPVESAAATTSTSGNLRSA
ncbi:MAG: KpsF/GutQ family sugar-phosphate isomerase [Planctomycetaceae bacterium]|nr:KpsF/GutQ family sugar-phosphate isomerase [Planctomycetaceae bacterium]